jgi:type IV pilus assembly protein PilA
MKRVQQGFTLIELMIVVAIVGILAAIALPAYQDYVIRSKMSEGEAAAAACKTSVSEYLSVHSAAGLAPIDTDLSGCSTTVTQFVSGLAVGAGVISVSTQNTGAGACVLVLTPTQGGGSDTGTIISWNGTHTGGCLSKHVPSVFR